MLCILDLNPVPDEKSSSPDWKSFFASQMASASETSGASANSPESEKKSARPAPRTAEVPVSEPVNIPEEPPVQAKARESVVQEPVVPSEIPVEEEEYELVLGRRQIASWLFVGTVLIAMFSTASYYVGRMTAPNPLAELDGKSESYIAPAAPITASLPEATIVRPEQNSDPQNATNPASATVSVSTTNPTSAAAAPNAPASSTPVQLEGVREWNNVAAAPASGEPPLFANPQPGGLYLQMGAVDKGVAVVLTEGLRRHGFNSIVAPGPSEKIFRVLIGPFATQEDFKRAKAEVDAIDLGTFARRFQK